MTKTTANTPVFTHEGTTQSVQIFPQMKGKRALSYHFRFAPQTYEGEPGAFDIRDLPAYRDFYQQSEPKLLALDPAAYETYLHDRAQWLNEVFSYHLHTIKRMRAK